MNGSVNKRGFRAVGIVEALEENLDRPFLTANQVAFWQALALSGSKPADRRLRADIWPQAAGLITLGSRWDSGTAGAAKTGCKPSRGDWRLVR
jgi:hypothetical protein